jgi:hypothetical protein
VTPGQIAGDCRKWQCDGAGNVVGADDDADVPLSDGSGCSSESCAGGIPLHPPLAAGTTCSQGGGTVCDGVGACVQCVQASDCGANTACRTYACNGGVCSTSNAPAGTVISNPTHGDCRTNQCDGNGNVLVNAVDATDLPPDDGNQCTSDICIAGAVFHSPVPASISCTQNGGRFCDGYGSCVWCLQESDCGNSDACRRYSCNAGSCSSSAAAAGTACPVGPLGGPGYCDGTGTCGLPPMVMSVWPAPGATATVPTDVSVTFRTPMNPATLTGQTAAGACTGSLHLSKDDFVTCVALASASPVMSGGDTTATITPAPGLLVNRTYQLRVTTAAAAAAGGTLLTAYTSDFVTATSPACTPQVVMSQIYGGGGDPGATYQFDYVELHNRGWSYASLDGWSIQYAPAGGTTWQVNPLAGTLVPGGYFLVQLGSGGATGSSLPTPDVAPASPSNISASAGKIALVSSTTAMSGPCGTPGVIVDFVGYGATATCTSSGAASQAPSASNTTALMRASACADQNVDATDFGVSAPTPRTSASAAEICHCGAVNESGLPLEADYCTVQFPLSIIIASGTPIGSIYGRIFEAGITETAGASAAVAAQLGWGPPTANPQTDPGWTWVPASYSSQVGNNDEYQATFATPAAGSYRYAYRFSLDGGVTWTYCDANQGDFGAGSNPGLLFELGDLPVLTVTP